MENISQNVGTQSWHLKFYTLIIFSINKMYRTSLAVVLSLHKSLMTFYSRQYLKSKIEWNFDKYQPNTIWKAQKDLKEQIITKDELDYQQNQMKKQILTSFIKDANPFRLVSQSHDFIIMDEKNKRKNQQNKFNFKQDVGLHEEGRLGSNNILTGTDKQFQSAKDLAHEAVHIIDCLKDHESNESEAKKGCYTFDLINKSEKNLAMRWAQCDKVINQQLAKLNHPLAQLLLKHFKQDGQAKVFLVGNNPLSIFHSKAQNSDQLKNFFAIKYEDNFPKLKKIINQNFKDIFNQKQTLCKFIIFNKEKQFFLLEFKANFTVEKSNNHKSLKCAIQVDDPQRLFFKAIQKSLQTTPKLFKNFTFEAHGDYIEYPFKESIARKRKFMKKESYSLVFQGGGAKGAAYVGAYKAIKEMKKNGKTVPITSIMGSSAGGIIALAVSTGIEPYEVQKICNKMETIPKIDKIDRGYLRTLERYIRDNKEASIIDKNIEQQKYAMFLKIGQLLNEYGIVQENVVGSVIRYVQKLDQDKLDKFWDSLTKWLLAKSESIGQMLDDNKGVNHEFNYLGLLLQGAMMRGDAIHDIGAQCLVKYVLSKDQQFLNQNYRDMLGTYLSGELKQHVEIFDKLCDAVLKISLQQLTDKTRNRVIFSILNQALTIFERSLQRYYKKEQQIFVLNEKFAITLLQYFDYKSCYNDALYPKEAEDIVHICPKLYKVVFNHHKLHPNSTAQMTTDISQKKERLKTITNFLKVKHEIPYQTLSQIICEEYFLNSQNFILNEKHNHITIGQLLKAIFTHRNGQDKQGIFKDTLFIRELAEIIVEKLGSEKIPNIFNQINKYNQNFEAFKKIVQRITLANYYQMTNIQMTCTAVDIDNKILRFFNHKTTPDLPVCRAVQMTGSFPGAFKAQSWKESWGKYFIHYNDYRRQVLLKGHEFTDGGMLANFPIKYFDNDYIRDVYFSHVVNRSIRNESKHPYQTIMLGFGLDMLDSSNYTSNERDIYRKNRKDQKQKQALYQLKKSIQQLTAYSGKHPIINAFIHSGSFRGLVGDYLFSNIKSLVSFTKINEIQWSYLNKNLINQIPLLRFGFKVIQAYPNADRNLNLQCFKDKVYRTIHAPYEKTALQKKRIKTVDLKRFIQRQINNNKKDIFEPKKSLWNKCKKSVQKFFSKAVVEDTQNLKTIIENSIKEAPLKLIFFDNIDKNFNSKIKAQMKAEERLSDEEMIKRKKKIKMLLVRIILNRMKLELSKNDISWHTLDFVTLKYRSLINYDTAFQDKQKQFRDAFRKIKKSFPYEKFKEQLLKRQAIMNDANKYDETELQQLHKQLLEQRKKAIIIQRKQYINRKIKSQNHKKEFLNIEEYFLIENSKSLVQYIFLQKINNEQQKYLEHANKMLKKISLKSLLRHFEYNSQKKYYQAHITIKNLKEFYHRIFSDDCKPSKNTKRFDPNTLLEEQSAREYQCEQFNENQVASAFEWPQKFNESIYIDQKLIVNTIVSQSLLLKRSYLQKIEFTNILGQVYLNKDNCKNIQDQLYKVITSNRDVRNKYNAILAEILYPDEQKLFTDEYFQTLLENADVKGSIIQLLFNIEDKYYSKHQCLLSKYKEEFTKFNKQKQIKLKNINETIKQQHSSNYTDNPINLQIQYLQHLEEKINYQLLISQIQSAKNLDYPLKNANITSGIWQDSPQAHINTIKNEINDGQAQRVKQCDRIIRRAKLFHSNFHILERLLNHTRVAFYQFQNQENPLPQIIEAGNVIEQNFIKIKEELIDQLNNTINLPVGSIKMRHIREIYTLDFEGIKQILKSLFQSMRIIKSIQKYGRVLDTYFKSLNQAFKYSDQTRYILPYFSIVWSIYKKEFNSYEYSDALRQGLNKQFTNSYISKCNNIRKINNQKSPFDINIHLTLEGSDLSNYYYAYYYELFEDFKKKLENESKDAKSYVPIPYQIERSVVTLDIKAITASSFHSIFGFLVALNYPLSRLKQQMSAIREIAHPFELKRLMNNYFDSYQWAKVNSQDYKDFWMYIKQEKYNVFNEIQKIANKQLPKHNLIEQFNEIRSIYQHEQDQVLKYCENILENIARQIESINNSIDPRYKALQISKKYAYDYTCNYQRQHEFTSDNQAAHKYYIQIIKHLFNAYGSLLEGIITNIYSLQLQIKLPTTQPGFISKGFIVKQLLTTFKIKEYVIKKLKENNLRQNITLSEFFKNAPHKILLNFTTINVHKERLEFMNKNTLPNMPVWAAIVSASCLPYFYRDFQCPRQWEHPASDTASLYDIFVNDFFKSNIINYKNARYISGNIISSIPLQLLTNETILSSKFTFQNEGQPYLHIGFAFDSQGDDYTNPMHMLKRNYLNISIWQLIKFKRISSTRKFNQICDKNQHKLDKQDGRYYNLPSKSQIFNGTFKKIVTSTQFAKYIGILSKSNDNYMLHAYWDRLIRLPIKFGTLDFHEITSTFLKMTYGADVPSDQAKDTIQRSYEITKYFAKKQFETINDRYEFIMRITLTQYEGQKDYFAKIQLLSHSKWNRNRFNNFLVYYSIKSVKFDQTAKIAMDSEILWNISDSSKVFLRFYFPKYAEEKIKDNEKMQQQQKANISKEKLKSLSFINKKIQMEKSQASTLQMNSEPLKVGNNHLKKEESISKQRIIQQNQNKDLPIYSSILFTQLEVNLINIINELPLKNSYDYKISFDQPLPQNEKVCDPFTKIMKSKPANQIVPFKKNRIPITIDTDSKCQLRNPPTLKVNTWSNNRKRGQQSNIQPRLPLK